MSVSRPQEQEHKTQNHHKKPENLAYLAGGCTAGILEIMLFHPFDTASKRLQTAKKQGHQKNTWEGFKQIIFKDAYQKSYSEHFSSAYKGIDSAMVYKVPQRVLKFGGQPIAKDFLEKNIGQSVIDAFGKKHGKVMLEAMAGSVIGGLEVSILFLDALKVRKQTGVPVGGFNVANIRSLYRGASITAARNLPGSFALFGGSAITKELYYGLDDYRKSTLWQEGVSSVVGSIASVTITNPLDVIKTRIQASGGTKTGFEVAKEIVFKESLTTFFKGLTPKLCAAAPKVAFAMTAAKIVTNSVGDGLTEMQSSLKMKK